MRFARKLAAFLVGGMAALAILAAVAGVLIYRTYNSGENESGLIGAVYLTALFLLLSPIVAILGGSIGLIVHNDKCSDESSGHRRSDRQQPDQSKAK